MWERTKVPALAHGEESNERDIYSNLRLPCSLLSDSPCFWRALNYFRSKTLAFWKTGVLVQGRIFSDSSLFCFCLSLWSLKLLILQKCHWEGKARELCLFEWNKADLHPSCCLPAFHAAASDTPTALWPCIQAGWRSVNLHHQSHSLWGMVAFWHLPATGLVRSTDWSRAGSWAQAFFPRCPVQFWLFWGLIWSLVKWMGHFPTLNRLLREAL